MTFNVAVSVKLSISQLRMMLCDFHTAQAQSRCDGVRGQNGDTWLETIKRDKVDAQRYTAKQ